MSVTRTSTRRGSPTGIDSGRSSGLDRLQPNPQWAKLPLFDRKGWKKLPFGAFADSIGERVEPADASDEIYVGLDDLDSGDLHIKRWGKGSDVIGTKLRFRKGDIIFGRRRAYQRKLAVAEFDGICSAHAMVVRAKPELVLPEFLPFLMMSDVFMKRAVEISVGSLSPTINWRTLKIEEFVLPSLDQQRRIAEIFWSVDALIEERNKVLVASISALTASNVEFFEKASARVEPLSSAIRNSAYGPRFSNSLYSSDGAIAQVRTTDISEDGVINYETIPRVDLKTDTMSDHILEDGDFLISRSGTCGIGAVFRDSGIPTVPGAFLIRIRLNARLLPDFLREYINSPVGRKHMDRLAAGGVQKNIRGSSLFAESVPIPSVEEQAEFLESCRTQRTFVALCSDAKVKTRELLMSIGNAIFTSS